MADRKNVVFCALRDGSSIKSSITFRQPCKRRHTEHITATNDFCANETWACVRNPHYRRGVCLVQGSCHARASYVLQVGPKHGRPLSPDATTRPRWARWSLLGATNPAWHAESCCAPTSPLLAAAAESAGVRPSASRAMHAAGALLASTNAAMACPAAAARCSGVAPEASVAAGPHLPLSRLSSRSSSPAAAAWCTAVRPAQKKASCAHVSNNALSQSFRKGWCDNESLHLLVKAIIAFH